MDNHREKEIIAAKLKELWEEFVRVNSGLPPADRLRLSDSGTCTELLEPKLGHYLRYCHDDAGKIVLGRMVRGTRDISVGVHITYEISTGRLLLGVPRARPWSHGFDRLNWYLIHDRDPEVILKNLMADRPIQQGLELYKTQY
jgi:hypothetical protein